MSESGFAGCEDWQDGLVGGCCLNCDSCDLYDWCDCVAGPGELAPGVPVFFGWELGVAGVEIPSVVEPGGLGFGKVAADGLDVGGTLSRWKRTQMIDDRREPRGKVAADGLDVGGTLSWKRTQMIDDRREPGLRAKCTEGIRGHGTMFREVCRLGSATGTSRRVSSAGTPRFRATSSGAQPSDRSRP